MEIEVTSDKRKTLPEGAGAALETELLHRLCQNYVDCKLIVRRTNRDGISVTGGTDSDNKLVEQILRETWECADDWFY